MPRIATSLALILVLAGSMSACQRNQTQQAQQTQQGQRGGHALRRICADDIAKYCQNDERKRQCLRQNMDKLGADCKAALQAAIAARRNRNDTTNSGSGNNNNNNND